MKANSSVVPEHGFIPVQTVTEYEKMVEYF